MIAAQKINWNDTPEKNVLRDCRDVVAHVRDALDRVEGRELPAEQVRQFIRDVHTVKGAVGFLNRNGLASGLHQLESILLSFLKPIDLIGSDDTSELFQEIERQLGQGLGQADLVSRTSRVHRFGESLWWSDELTQKTAVKLGKRVFLMVHGGEQELPAAVHRVLQMVLVHLVRNAVTHGIETPEIRRAAGKSAIGLITLSAVKRNDVLEVSVWDNGAGIDADATSTIFDMGQTTAEKVSEYSGRGVGLTTVRDLVVEAGGEVTVTSNAGEGVTFTMTFASI